VSRSDRAPRQRSRQVALQTLYARDFADPQQAEGEASIEEVFERVAQNFDLPVGARDFALELVTGTTAELSEIDDLLAANAINWKISRMATVDRNVLRLGIYELTRTDTPVSVVLDEAIQLARRFGGESSPGFVNGVLDAVARHVGKQLKLDAATTQTGEQAKSEAATTQVGEQAGDGAVSNQAGDGAVGNQVGGQAESDVKEGRESGRGVG
jgi:N utilization substance protein B